MVWRLGTEVNPVPDLRTGVVSTARMRSEGLIGWSKARLLTASAAILAMSSGVLAHDARSPGVWEENSQLAHKVVNSLSRFR